MQNLYIFNFANISARYERKKQTLDLSGKFIFLEKFNGLEIGKHLCIYVHKYTRVQCTHYTQDVKLFSRESPAHRDVKNIQHEVVNFNRR